MSRSRMFEVTESADVSPGVVRGVRTNGFIREEEVNFEI